MPDRDAILRGIYSLPLIDNRGNSGNIPPGEGLSWKGSDHDAKFWVTREMKFSNPYYVLRTMGDMRDRALVERDFTTHLGPPAERSSEVGFPVVDTTLWRERTIKHLLDSHNLPKA